MTPSLSGIIRAINSWANWRDVRSHKMCSPFREKFNYNYLPASASDNRLAPVIKQAVLIENSIFNKKSSEPSPFMASVGRVEVTSVMLHEYSTEPSRRHH